MEELGEGTEGVLLIGTSKVKTLSLLEVVSVTVSLTFPPYVIRVENVMCFLSCVQGREEKLI